MGKNLLILRHTPLDVDEKMFECFAKDYWDGDVVVYAETSFDECRSDCGYSGTTRYIKTIIMDKEKIQFDDSFFSENKDAYILFNGLEMTRNCLQYIKKYKIQFGIVSERNNSLYNALNRSRIKDILKSPFRIIKNSYLINKVSCFLARGKVGVDCFRKYYGFKKNKLFNLMYSDGATSLFPKEYTVGKPIRFVYVGRFDYKNKGVDIMLDAFTGIGGDWSLDLIGNYGADAEDIKNRVKNMDGVECIGVCDRNKICEKLNEYDVIIVPSKLDGWNLHCNLSINAGIGAIVTDQTVSHELVEKCGNGIVIAANDSGLMREAIQAVIDEPEKINYWKEKTKAFSDNISCDTVAKYLADVLKYTSSNDVKERPVCPWN